MDDAAARAAAESIAAALCRKEFDSVQPRLHPRMRREYGTRLKVDVTRETEPLGAFLGTGPIAAGEEDDFVRAVVECSFERGSAAVQLAFDPQGRVVELFIRAARGRAPRARSLLSVALVVAVAAGFFVAMRAAGASLEPAPFIVGTMGWGLALALRAPITLALRGRQPAAILLSSAVLTEAARIAAVLSAGETFDAAASIALGWVSVDALFAIAVLAGFTRARERTPGPAVYALDQAAMFAFHIGAILLIAWDPVAAVGTAAARAAVDLYAARSPESWGSTAARTAAGAAAIVAGLWVFGRLG